MQQEAIFSPTRTMIRRIEVGDWVGEDYCELEHFTFHPTRDVPLIQSDDFGIEIDENDWQEESAAFWLSEIAKQKEQEEAKRCGLEQLDEEGTDQWDKMESELISKGITECKRK